MKRIVFFLLFNSLMVSCGIWKKTDTTTDTNSKTNTSVMYRDTTLKMMLPRDAVNIAIPFILNAQLKSDTVKVSNGNSTAMAYVEDGKIYLFLWNKPDSLEFMFKNALRFENTQTVITKDEKKVITKRTDIIKWIGLCVAGCVLILLIDLKLRS